MYLFGPAWWGSLRGLPILHYLYHAVPVVAVCLFQRRVVPLLCLSCVCVCSSCRKSLSSWCSPDQDRLVCLLLMALYILYRPLWSNRVVLEKWDVWQTCLNKMGYVSKSLRKAYRQEELVVSLRGGNPWENKMTKVTFWGAKWQYNLRQICPLCDQNHKALFKTVFHGIFLW